MTTRKYSSRSQQTTLAANLSSSGTSATVVSGSSLLAGITIASGETYTVVIDPDTALEEIVDVTAAAGNSLTVVRGIDGSTGQSHSAGAIVRHMATGRDFREANSHISAVDNVHGISGAFVGTTDTQTVTNKTLGSGTVLGASIDAATYSITGLGTPATSSSAATKAYVDAVAGSATAAASSASAASTSATAAATSATNAATSATAAASSATSASGSATSATSSASSASTSASTATTKASEASTSATNAASSASGASTSATAASGSASTATTKASEAATSATNAASSASAASTSATNAASSATAAAGSATSAAAALVSVTDQVGSGLARDMGSITTEDTTTGDWVDLSDVANAAAASASAASTSASNASTSASNAATSATNASNSASAASTSATNAEASDVSAQDWATKTSGAVAGGEYSAKYHAQAASTSATNAAASAVTAASYIPSQTGNNGKFLTTDGTSASWVSISDWGTL